MASNFQLLLLLASSVLLLALGPQLIGGSSIGVCYGMLGDNLPSPSHVVAMYKTHHISRMRIYEPNHSMLNALRHSGIQLSVGVRHEDIPNLASSYVEANNWVNNNIRKYWPNVIFRYIVVGNDVIPGNYSQYVLPAIKNLHNALSTGGLWHKIKVSTAVSTSVMSVSYPPSSGEFSNKTVKYMEPIAKYLDSIGAPLLANVYPYFSYVDHPEQIWLPYVLFLEQTDVFTDFGIGYRNLFDASVDALYASLEKVGVPEISIVVSETGWPSAGNNDSTKKWIAWLYNSNLARHVLSMEGTPRRPGKAIETYVFSMFDGDMKVEGLSTEQHFGLFYPDLEPVYPINFI